MQPFVYLFPSRNKAELYGEISSRSNVLDIGAGFGMNVRYLPKDIEYVALEPDIKKHILILKEIKKRGIQKYSIVSSFAEEMDFEDNYFDFVISSLTLCSITNVQKTLDQIWRVLKPQGKYLFIDHVKAKEGSFLLWCQNKLKRIWKIKVGCELDRDIEEEIKSSQLIPIKIEYHYFLLQPLISRRIRGNMEK